jgi:putative endonuclease
VGGTCRSRPFAYSGRGNQRFNHYRHPREGGDPTPGIKMHADFQPTVYILASRRYGTLYVGVTSHLMRRMHQHREGDFEGFTADHNVKMLIWYEQHGTMEAAIGREKQIKKWNRQWKINLIETENPNWRDLAVDLGFIPLPSRTL